MRSILLLTLLYCLCSCRPDQPPHAAPAYETTGGDSTAIRIAHEVMEAMGGQSTWDQVETISWTFFGRRKHRWNKQTGDITIETIADSSTITMTLGDSTSIQAEIGDSMITDPLALQDYYRRGTSIWINDSYWLVMPYKLLDPGVMLTYEGDTTLADGKSADLLRLEFDKVGDTPDNAYVVTVPRETKLVSQWDFYRSAQDTTANFSTPWKDYKKYGGILLSGDRGRARLDDIAVTMLN